MFTRRQVIDLPGHRTDDHHRLLLSTLAAVGEPCLGSTAQVTPRRPSFGTRPANTYGTNRVTARAPAIFVACAMRSARLRDGSHGAPVEPRLLPWGDHRRLRVSATARVNA